MTITIALIVNGLLVGALLVALFLVMRIPFRLDRPRRLTAAVDVADPDERGLSRAA
jgi:hypothetical protein